MVLKNYSSLGFKKILQFVSFLFFFCLCSSTWTSLAPSSEVSHHFWGGHIWLLGRGQPWVGSPSSFDVFPAASHPVQWLWTVDLEQFQNCIPFQFPKEWLDCSAVLIPFCSRTVPAIVKHTEFCFVFGRDFSWFLWLVVWLWTAQSPSFSGRSEGAHGPGEAPAGGWRGPAESGARPELSASKQREGRKNESRCQQSEK